MSAGIQQIAADMYVGIRHARTWTATANNGQEKNFCFAFNDLMIP
ncbi:hypothetical protein LMG26411_07085 [Cupriavidus numazuensis]|uniref:Uncharacterized protein n=1 Tax=Cupriavidus numazuensis TaxID=221992 RepID=A0ABM8TTU6_9BURK|nr:hypothetical protein LMG26411_07085 [Cupriavidus numazuensis]